MTIKKVYSAIGPLKQYFFSEHLPILARCKTKGTVRALCALLQNWQLGAYIKGSHRMGDGRIFINIMVHLSLNGANKPYFGQIHLADSTFNERLACILQ
jgi:hypothetical protein